MVQRMIGIKVGTGGSSGYDYLRSTAGYVLLLVHLLHSSGALLCLFVIFPLETGIRCF